MVSQAIVLRSSCGVLFVNYVFAVYDRFLEELAFSYFSSHVVVAQTFENLVQVI